MNIRSVLFAIAATVAAAGSTLFAAGPIHAADVGGVTTARVFYGDLNLVSAEGRQVAGNRIRAAAQRLCGDAQIIELKQLLKVRQCQAQAIAFATDQLDAAAYASRRTGKIQLGSR